MLTTKIDIQTPDGVADCHFFQPDGEGPHPAVLFFMDGLGIRQALLDMAERLTQNGYAVLLPNLYYRLGPATGPIERERIMEFVRTVTNAKTMEDTKEYLAFLESQPGVNATRIGCTGYCMGGGPSLSAAGTFPDRVAAAASFHGGRLATDAPDSPHLLAPKMRGEIYVGVAGIDPHVPIEETQRLEAALKDADVNCTIEIYPDVHHGFAVTASHAYDHDASERHWEKLLSLFQRNLM